MLAVKNFKAIKQKVSVTLKQKKEVRSSLRRLTASVYQAYKAEMKVFHLELLQQRKAVLFNAMQRIFTG